MLLAVASWAGVGGRVSGTVKDASNAVVPNATVEATNVGTRFQHRVITNNQGFYSFPDLPIGLYDIAIEKTGFTLYQRTGIVIDANSALVVDAVLKVGEATQAVTVRDSVVNAEASETQMGEVISGAKMVAVPLNGRSYTDLLALQPGVVPVTSLSSNTEQDVGVSALSPSGDLNPGTISISGQREFSNGFNGDHSEPRLHCRVPHRHQQCGCGIRRTYRRTDQRHYEIGQQRISWRRLRVLAQYGPRRAQLLLSDARSV
jgi:hypothetical protein